MESSGIDQTTCTTLTALDQPLILGQAGQLLWCYSSCIRLSSSLMSCRITSAKHHRPTLASVLDSDRGNSLLQRCFPGRTLLTASIFTCQDNRGRKLWLAFPCRPKVFSSKFSLAYACHSRPVGGLSAATSSPRWLLSVPTPAHWYAVNDLSRTYFNVTLWTTSLIVQPLIWALKCVSFWMAKTFSSVPNQLYLKEPAKNRPINGLKTTAVGVSTIWT